VFGGHQQESIRSIDGRAPVLGVLEMIMAEPRMLGLVEHGQIERFEVDDRNRPFRVLARLGFDPLGDRQALAALARARDDDQKLMHWETSDSAAGMSCPYRRRRAAV